MATPKKPPAGTKSFNPRPSNAERTIHAGKIAKGGGSKKGK